MGNTRKYLSALVVCALIACLFALAACSTSANEGISVGDSQAGAVVIVNNETGKDIEAFYLKVTGTSEYGDALAQDGLVPAGAVLNIHYAADNKAAQDLKFCSNDGACYELTALKFANMKDASLKLSTSGTTCYLEYTDASTGERKSILQSEQLAQKEASARSEADKQLAKAKKEAEKSKKEADKAKKDIEQMKKDAAAAAAAAEQESEAEGSSYSEPSSSYSGGSSSSSSSSKSSSSSSSSKGSSSSSSSSKKESSSSSSKGSGSSSGSGADSGGEDNRCIEL